MGINLFYDDRKPSGSKRPDYKGNGDVAPDVAAYIAERLKAGDDKIELEIVGWKKQGRNGPYQSLVIEIPWKVRKEREGGGDRDRGDRRDSRRDDRDDRGRRDDRDDRGRRDDRDDRDDRRARDDRDDRGRRDDRGDDRRARDDRDDRDDRGRRDDRDDRGRRDDRDDRRDDRRPARSVNDDDIPF
ncbi:putative RNA 2'-phosphotransferase [Planktothrix phage Pag-Yong1]|nr:putative RNA 2'-phosphotransferase [Planktothrix phage Pag-Yong1]WEV89234.1 transcription termination factor Rho [Synechococcus phage MinM2]